MTFLSKKDIFLTSFWAPLDLKNATKTNAFLSILPLQKDDILERLFSTPRITKIEKGLPVKDVEQKSRFSEIFQIRKNRNIAY